MSDREHEVGFGSLIVVALFGLFLWSLWSHIPFMITMLIWVFGIIYIFERVLWDYSGSFPLISRHYFTTVAAQRLKIQAMGGEDTLRGVDWEALNSERMQSWKRSFHDSINLNYAYYNKYRGWVYPVSTYRLAVYSALLMMVAILSISTNILGNIGHNFTLPGATVERLYLPLYDQRGRRAAHPLLTRHFSGFGSKEPLYIYGSSSDVRYFGAVSGSDYDVYRKPIPFSATIFNDSEFQRITNYSPVVFSNFEFTPLGASASTNFREWHKVNGGRFSIRISGISDVSDFAKTGRNKAGLIVEYQLRDTSVANSIFSQNAVTHAVAKYVHAPIVSLFNLYENVALYRYPGERLEEETTERKKRFHTKPSSAGTFNLEDIMPEIPRRTIGENLGHWPAFLFSILDGGWYGEYRHQVAQIDRVYADWRNPVTISKKKLECELRAFVAGSVTYKCD